MLGRVVEAPEGEKAPLQPQGNPGVPADLLLPGRGTRTDPSRDSECADSAHGDHDRSTGGLEASRANHGPACCTRAAAAPPTVALPVADTIGDDDFPGRLAEARHDRVDPVRRDRSTPVRVTPTRLSLRPYLDNAGAGASLLPRRTASMRRDCWSASFPAVSDTPVEGRLGFSFPQER